MLCTRQLQLTWLIPGIYQVCMYLVPGNDTTVLDAGHWHMQPSSRLLKQYIYQQGMYVPNDE